MRKTTRSSRPAAVRSEDLGDRVAALDWAALTSELDAHGCAVIPSSLSAGECGAIAAMYSDAAPFRSRVVMARHGCPLVSETELRQRLGWPSDALLPLTLVQAPTIEVASRDLRQRVAKGRSIRYFLPRSVEIYIREKRLYHEARPEPSTRPALYRCWARREAMCCG